jgi:hydroxymethylpyrimidine/phosphomethylpyrimidine kinase
MSLPFVFVSPCNRGLEADQKVAAAHQCYAMTATTALTAQNTQGVFGIHEIPAQFVQKQIETCLEDIPVNAIKTGMEPLLKQMVTN